MTETPDIRAFEADAFAEEAAHVIAAALRSTFASGSVAVALAGGSTPRAVYHALARLEDVPWQRISIWFGDERAVPSDHADSNFAMARAALLAQVPVANENVHRMEAERADLDAAARDYEAALPANLDVLLLGVGDDGHTASLFPGAKTVHERIRKVVAASDAHHLHRRLTITPPVITAARQVMVLGTGSAKAPAIARALDENTDPLQCPARFARSAIWLLDMDAARLVNAS